MHACRRIWHIRSASRKTRSPMPWAKSPTPDDRLARLGGVLGDGLSGSVEHVEHWGGLWPAPKSGVREGGLSARMSIIISCSRAQVWTRQPAMWAARPDSLRTPETDCPAPRSEPSARVIIEIRALSVSSRTSIRSTLVRTHRMVSVSTPRGVSPPDAPQGRQCRQRSCFSSV